MASVPIYSGSLSFGAALDGLIATDPNKLAKLNTGAQLAASAAGFYASVNVFASGTAFVAGSAAAATQAAQFIQDLPTASATTLIGEGATFIGDLAIAGGALVTASGFGAGYSNLFTAIGSAAAGVSVATTDPQALINAVNSGVQQLESAGSAILNSIGTTLQNAGAAFQVVNGPTPNDPSAGQYVSSTISQNVQTLVSYTNTQQIENIYDPDGSGGLNTINGNGNGSGEYTEVLDSGEDLNLSDSGSIILVASNLQNETITGNAASVEASGVNGLTLRMDSGSFNLVNGENNTISQGNNTGSTTYLRGTGNHVTDDSGNDVSNLIGDGSQAQIDGNGIGNMVGNNQQINSTGVGFTSAEANGTSGDTFIGNASTVYFGSGVTGSLAYGNSNAIGLADNTGSSVSAYGQNLTVGGVSGNNVLTLDGTGSSATVYGDGKTIITASNQTVNAIGGTVVVADGVTGTTIYTSNGQVDEGQNDGVDVVGPGDTVNGGPTDTNTGDQEGYDGGGTTMPSDGGSAPPDGPAPAPPDPEPAPSEPPGVYYGGGGGSDGGSDGGETDFASVSKTLSTKSTVPFTSTAKAGATSPDVTSSGGAAPTGAATAFTSASSAARGGSGGDAQGGTSSTIAGASSADASVGASITSSAALGGSEEAMQGGTLSAVAVGNGASPAGVAAVSSSPSAAAAASLAEAQREALSTQLPGAATTPVYNGAKWEVADAVPASNGGTSAASAASPTITWSFASAPSSALDPFSGYLQTQYKATVEQAMQAWAAASGLTFQEVPDSASSDIRIGWGDFDTSDSGILGYTNWTAQGGAMQPGTIVRLEDPSQTALVAGPGGQLTYAGTQATLYQVVLHEVGHALGLADDADTGSVMFTASSPSNRTLDQTDVNGIQALYGTSPAATSTTPSIPAQTPLPAPADTTGLGQLIQAMATFSPHLAAGALNPAMEAVAAAPQLAAAAHA